MKKKWWIIVLSVVGALCVAGGVVVFCIMGTGTRYVKSGNFRYMLDRSTDTYTVSANRDVEITGNLEIPASFKEKPVTSIEDRAFCECIGLTSVTIPDSITYIGYSAFMDCTGLTSVTIGNSVETIESSAFAGCISLEIIEIPDSVTLIDSYTFEGCSKLASVTIGNGVTTIEYEAFRDCSELTSLTIGDGITSIDSQAFYNCDNIKTVTMPAIAFSCLIDSHWYPLRHSLETVVITSGDSIDSHAFYQFEELTSVTIEDVASIGEEAFLECHKLTSVTLGDGVSYIDYNAFNSCYSLEKITVSEGNAAYSSQDGILYDKEKTEIKWVPYVIEGSVTIPDGVTSIYGNTFDCPRLKSITIGEGVEWIDESAFDECYSLEKITVSEGNVAYSSRDGILYNKSMTEIKWVPYAVKGAVTIPDGVLSIGENVFNGRIRMTSVEIPDSVTSIGWDAFYECYGLTKVVIGSGVTTIGNDAFRNCYKLIEVWNHSDLRLSDGEYHYSYITSYAKHVYSGQQEGYQTITDDGYIFYEEGSVSYLLGYCGDETSLALPQSSPTSSDYKIYDYAFYANYDLTDIEISDGVTSIGDNAFYDCDGLTSVTIGDRVLSIGEAAFSWCYELTSVTIGNNVSSIGDEAFDGCNALKEFIVSEENETYSSQSGILYDKEKTEIILVLYAIEGDIILPDSLLSIGDDAFRYHDGLTSIVIGQGVTSIGDNAFYDCDGLTSIVIGQGVTSIGEQVFDGCSQLKELVVDEENTAYSSQDGILFDKEKTEIILVPYAIEGDVVLPDSLLSIDAEAFSERKGLTSIVIGQSVATIGDRAFYECYWLESVVMGQGVTSIGDEAFYDCSLKSITIGEGVTHIGSNAFGRCNSLESIEVDKGNSVYYSEGNCLIGTNTRRLILGCKNSVIPEDVDWIGDHAFYGCALTSIVIPDGVASIGDYAFYECSELTSIELPDSVTAIGDNAFFNCNALTSIELPEELSWIGAGAFNDCDGLTSITIPDGVTMIGDETFKVCIALTSIVIPENVTSIGKYAFSDCIALTSIVIPEKVTSIGEKAFSGCNALKSIVIPEKVTSIGEYAFSDCNALKSVIWNAADCTVPTGCIFSNSPIESLTFGEHVEVIPDWAFAGCSELTVIEIPKSVKTIGEKAFSDCTGLEKYVVAEGNSNYSSQDGILYNSAKTRIIDVPSAIAGAVVIPDGVYEIGENAFRECNKLTSIEIPTSVTSIGENAFSGCTGLEQVRYAGSAEQWQDVEIYDNNSSLTSARFEYVMDAIIKAIEDSLAAESYAASVENELFVMKSRFDFANKIVSIELEEATSGESIANLLRAVADEKVYVYSDASGEWLRVEAEGDPESFASFSQLETLKTAWEAFKQRGSNLKKNALGEYEVGNYALTIEDGYISVMRDTRRGGATATLSEFNAVTLSLPTLGHVDEAVRQRFMEGLTNSMTATTFHSEYTLEGVLYSTDAENGKCSDTMMYMEGFPVAEMYREINNNMLSYWMRMNEESTWSSWEFNGTMAATGDLYTQNIVNIITGGNDPSLLFILAKYDAATDSYIIRDYNFLEGELIEYSIKIEDGYVTQWTLVHGNAGLDVEEGLTIYYSQYNTATVSKPQDIVG